MPKLYIILGILAAASAVFVLFPGTLEHMSHFGHWLTLVVSGHHIAEQVAHSIHPRSEAKA